MGGNILSGIRDNHKRGKVGEFLREKIQAGSKLSFVSAYFTIYAYEAMRATLESVDSVRFLFGEPRFVSNLDPEKTDKKAFNIEDAGLQLAGRLQQRPAAAACADWIRRKVEIRSVRYPGFLHGKLYHVEGANGVQSALLGSSNFTAGGLGLGTGHRNNVELNLVVDGDRDRQDLLAWFNDIWIEDDVVADVKAEVLAYLEQLYTNHAPDFIYFKTLFHIFEDYLREADKGGLLDARTGFFETEVWKMLYDFQKDGVKGAINKILKHNGCIIADSVGLGKTFEALAVIKYFELRNARVLVLCPKKLEDNWQVFRQNDTRNPLIKDRFAYTVLAHTDLGRDGMAGDINLSTHNWGNYDLVVLDESHNFRNNARGKERDDGTRRRSRYEILMQDILQSGVKTQVLLLSATPVNTNLKDLRNQFLLITQDTDRAFEQSLDIFSIAQVMKNAQTHFTNWADPKKKPERKTARLLEVLDSSFFKLMDELTIARSRKHIVSYYGNPVAQASSLPDARTGKQDACPTFFDPLQPVDISKRNLPHWNQQDCMYFVTFRLADALPADKLRQLQQERDEWTRTHTQPLSDAEQVEYQRLFSDRVNQWLDAGAGSCCLADERVARIVADALRYFDGERYRLDEWVVMPNHVHALLTPLGAQKVGDILHSWKSYTSTKINKLTNRDGQLWQHESYDRLVRNSGELAHFRHYIHENPAKAKVKVAQASSLRESAVVVQASSLPDAITGKQDACPTLVFPQRLKPLSRSTVTDLKGYFPTYDDLTEAIDGYKLTIFNPTAYLLDAHVNAYARDGQQLALFNDQKSRESFLIGMMRTNYLKRLESSVHSFEISMERTIEKIKGLLDKIAHFEANIAAYANQELPLDLPDVDDDDDLADLRERLTVGHKLVIRLDHLDRARWKKDLQADLKQLIAIHEKAAAITPDRDAKLQELKRLIADKVANPINPGNRKVLVFTAFSDTATYLYAQIERWAREQLGLHIGLVSGSDENRTTFKPSGFQRQTDFISILTNFSPRAKQREKMTGMPQEGGIDILIATDCISEGQNLQDCDYLINYDIHWNPVRIIQRFGRIDRLGSINRCIQLVNFWPTDDLNKYLNLKDRVESRMALVDIAATGADNLLDPDQIHDLIEEELTYREKQLMRLRDEVIDLEDMDDNVSLSEFTLDDFRIELMNFLENNRKALQDAPLGLYGLVPTLDASKSPDLFDQNWREIVRPGVLFCLRHKHPPTDEKRSSNVNPLGAYYLLYIRDDGTVRFTFTQAKSALTLFQKLCAGKTEPYQALCDLFDQETGNGRRMEKYDALLQRAVASITATFRKRMAAGLTTGRDFVLPVQAEQARSEADFELITWLVIKD